MQIIQRRIFGFLVEKKFWKYLIWEGKNVLVMQSLIFFQKQDSILFPPFPEVFLSGETVCTDVSSQFSTALAVADAFVSCSSSGTQRAKSQFPPWQAKSAFVLVTGGREKKIPQRYILDRCILMKISWLAVLTQSQRLHSQKCYLQ